MNKRTLHVYVPLIRRLRYCRDPQERRQSQVESRSALAYVEESNAIVPLVFVSPNIS